MQRDWKSEFGFLFLTLGVTGLAWEHSIDHERAIDEQIIADRWTPDDEAMAIEEESLAEQKARGLPVPMRMAPQRLMDLPIGDFPTRPLRHKAPEVQ